MSKVADNWKMNNSLELLHNMLRRHSKVKVHHVQRKVNKLTDLVANYGVKKKQELQQLCWEDNIEDNLRSKCQRILEKDLIKPESG